MQTEALIAALQADRRPTAVSLSAAWWGAAGLAALVAAAVFSTLGPRPDIANAVHSARFLFKFVATVTLAISAFAAVRALSRPDGGRVLPWLATAPVLLVIAIALELAAVPAGDWSRQLVGSNSLVCLTYIPLIGMGPLAVFLLVLRHGAPTRPALTGAIGGMVAGGLAATFYAAHCPDDSPLFVAVWYTLAVTLLAAVGALAGRWWVRW
jgi:hypothetical protein